jgi:hypothetical protein
MSLTWRRYCDRPVAYNMSNVESESSATSKRTQDPSDENDRALGKKVDQIP